MKLWRSLQRGLWSAFFRSAEPSDGSELGRCGLRANRSTDAAARAGRASRCQGASRHACSWWHADRRGGRRRRPIIYEKPRTAKSPRDGSAGIMGGCTDRPRPGARCRGQPAINEFLGECEMGRPLHHCTPRCRLPGGEWAWWMGEGVGLSSVVR